MVKHIFIFDVDGVITNPIEKKVTEPEILILLAKLLMNGNPIILNTGRSIEKMNEKVINILLAKSGHKEIFKNLFAVGEFGGVWEEFNEKGHAIYKIDSSLVISKNLSDRIKKIVKNEFSDCMLFDSSKETIITIEMLDGYSMRKYKMRQKVFVGKLKEFINKSNFPNLELHADTIAVNIMNKKLGKDYAIDLILKWLKSKNIQHKDFTTVGDSEPDLLMAKRLNQKGFNVKFVYVGKDKIEKDIYNFPIILTTDKFEKGTLEFLKNR